MSIDSIEPKTHTQEVPATDDQPSDKLRRRELLRSVLDKNPQTATQQGETPQPEFLKARIGRRAAIMLLAATSLTALGGLAANQTGALERAWSNLGALEQSGQVKGDSLASLDIPRNELLAHPQAISKVAYLSGAEGPRTIFAAHADGNLYASSWERTTNLRLPFKTLSRLPVGEVSSLEVSPKSGFLLLAGGKDLNPGFRAPTPGAYLSYDGGASFVRVDALLPGIIEKALWSPQGWIVQFNQMTRAKLALIDPVSKRFTQLKHQNNGGDLRIGSLQDIVLNPTSTQGEYLAYTCTTGNIKDVPGIAETTIDLKKGFGVKRVYSTKWQPSALALEKDKNGFARGIFGISNLGRQVFEFDRHTKEQTEVVSFGDLAKVIESSRKTSVSFLTLNQINRLENSIAVVGTFSEGNTRLPFIATKKDGEASLNIFVLDGFPNYQIDNLEFIASKAYRTLNIIGVNIEYGGSVYGYNLLLRDYSTKKGLGFVFVTANQDGKLISPKVSFPNLGLPTS